MFSLLTLCSRFRSTTNTQHERKQNGLIKVLLHYWQAVINMSCERSIFIYRRDEDKIWPIQTWLLCHLSVFSNIIQKAWLIKNRAFKADCFDPCPQQNRALDPLETIAVLCATGIQAQVFLKLFTTSNIMKTKREKQALDYHWGSRRYNNSWQELHGIHILLLQAFWDPCNKKRWKKNASRSKDFSDNLTDQCGFEMWKE